MMSVTLENISLSKFTSNQAAGSKSEGDYFSLVGSVQHRIQQITVYLAENCIRRVSVKKFDQTCIVIGGSDGTESPASHSIAWSFEPNEEFKQIFLYSGGDKLVGMELSTNIQENLKVLAKGDGSINTLEVKTGSGKCVGVFGHAGVHVFSLGFAVLKKEK